MRSIDDIVERQSQRKRNSNNSNDDGMSLAFIESEHIDTDSDSLIDEVIQEPIVFEDDQGEPILIEDDSEEPIIVEDDLEEPILVEDDPDEPIIVEDGSEKPILVEYDPEEPIIVEDDLEEPILVKDDTSESSDDFSQDGNSDGDLLRSIEPMDENSIDIKFKTNYERILFQKYFQKAFKRENNMTASCKLCNSILKSNASCYDLLLHFKVCKMDLYL